MGGGVPYDPDGPGGKPSLDKVREAFDKLEERLE